MENMESLEELVITWKQSNARARDPIVFLQRYIGKISHFLNINY